MEITPNHILQIGFGIVAIATFLTVALMRYRPGERLVPFLMASVSLLAWIEWVTIDADAGPLYDMILGMLAFISFYTNSGFWRFGMLAASLASIVNYGLRMIWSDAPYDVALAMVVFNNMLVLVQSFFLIVSATRTSLTFWLHRRNNRYDYFAHRPRHYIKPPS